jgi:hypothetical protein
VVIGLSRSKVLNRSADLKEVCRFLQDSGFPLHQHFLEKKLLVPLSYLSDIFDKHNGLNSSLQGPSTSVFLFLHGFGLNEKDDAVEKLL